MSEPSKSNLSPADRQARMLLSAFFAAICAGITILSFIMMLALMLEPICKGCRLDDPYIYVFGPVLCFGSGLVFAIGAAVLSIKTTRYARMKRGDEAGQR